MTDTKDNVRWLRKMQAGDEHDVEDCARFDAIADEIAALREANAVLREREKILLKPGRKDALIKGVASERAAAFKALEEAVAELAALREANASLRALDRTVQYEEAIHGMAKQIAAKDTEIERLNLQIDARNSWASGELAAKDAQIAKLTEEVRVLRLYGNKDCTNMADDAMRADEGEGN